MAEMTVLVPGSDQNDKDIAQSGSVEQSGMTSRWEVRKRMSRMVTQAQTCSAANRAETQEEWGNMRFHDINTSHTCHISWKVTCRITSMRFCDFSWSNLADLAWLGNYHKAAPIEAKNLESANTKEWNMLPWIMEYYWYLSLWYNDTFVMASVSV